MYRDTPLDYNVFLKAITLWMSERMGISTEEFAKRFGSRFGRAGGASAALNAGVPEAIIRKHGDWKSAALFRYIEYSLEVESTTVRAIA